MKYVFQLKQDHPELARDEALTLCNGQAIEQYGDILVASGNEADWERLGLARTVGRHVFTCLENRLADEITLTNWNDVINGTYKVVLHHSHQSPKDVARLVWLSAPEKTVNITQPNTILDLAYAEGQVVASTRIWTSTERFEDRRMHTLPAMHPSGMHPKIARAIVNMTGVPGNGKLGEPNDALLDPFCGAGGFLIEAARMGVRAQGSDFDSEQVRRANTNLAPYGITVTQRDATTLDKPIKYLAADLPYGKSTKMSDAQNLYQKFFKKLDELLTGRAVIVLPKPTDLDRLTSGTKLEIKATYDVYSHRSLTRRIVVLERARATEG